MLAPRFPHDPAPLPGLSRADFTCIGKAGLGDGHNNYAHSMAWFNGKLYLGTTRSNLCMLRMQSSYSDMPFTTWPVECPETMDELYKLDRRAQIWCYDPSTLSWEMVFRAPMVDGIGGGKVPREIGYRSMQIFQGAGDPAPALYVSAWAPGRAPGGLIMRTYDGRTFEQISRYGILENAPISTTRCLTAFKGRMFFSPTAKRGTDGAQQNTTGLPVVFESADPASNEWLEASEFGFGDVGNLGIFTLCAEGDRLYAGTFNLDGLQVWASDCEGKPPYRWTKLIDKGAYRGPLNQAVASMTGFKGSVYVGSGIQGGGYDRVNGVGPAGSELIRINPDDSWDLIVGEPRDTPDGRREPLSVMRSGFGNLFNGYFWTLGVHKDWLYLGTYDWTVTLRWTENDAAPARVQRLFQLMTREQLIDHEGGADLWRTSDGDNWLPVTRKGFENPYNFGIRNLVSSDVGLFVGIANVFGPRVAVRRGDGWEYQDNPDGGLEVWLGDKVAT
ncbi:hypothetical protein [Ancylobacter pratisalsi]|uniref:Exo-alpha-sialidase n=1 Tax=Ancylobacter pratisalsi TaxID=1745854 RepID=A0A6P1YP25_9HYPH|nr:hypothetical protein [Ancylobacter pratisalsi]QIB35168.1 hypothetical protein G3A50_16720 [Ancylobacter pratisalsi]